MRRGQQPGMHRTPHTTHDTHPIHGSRHTHTQPCRNTNTQMEEGEANRSGTQGSTACTYGESGPSCLHPSRRVRTHTRGGAAHTATQKQSNNEKEEIPAHTTWIVGPREVQPIFITKTIQLPSAFVHIQRTPLHAGTAIASAAAAAHAKISAGNGIRQATIYLCFCLDVGRCLNALFCFAEGETSCLGRVLGIPAGCTIIFFFPLVKFACVGAANNSVCVVPASLCYSAAIKNNLPGRWPNPEFPNNRNQTR
ncbi:hypothetical protein ECC02_004318 [Trypanosoma cruzi]|uniref:Uncharacterized protein n=1 Tax=Trypanosoma cruzi TaxID=5693 RepID=A0A7J6Y7K1_TRYCR|nr:hypothetical protein ECC02_004318 [Trypanosoma cruzi]